MRRLLQELDRNAERYLMFVCYAFVCAVIIQEVGRRYLLNYSSAWAEETARYAFIYLGWIGAAYAVTRARAHPLRHRSQPACPRGCTATCTCSRSS